MLRRKPKPAPVVPQTERRDVYLMDTAHGPEWQCRAGQTEPPVGCQRHAEHYWCDTCQGYYGVPHDTIHDGPGAHPTTASRRDCACRPCTKARVDWRAALIVG